MKSNYTVLKEPTETITPFTQIIRWLILNNVGWKTFSTFFWKDQMIINFANASSHKCFVRVFEQLDQKWLGRPIHFLFLSKIHKLCFKNSSCKLLSLNNSTNSSWAWQVCGLLKFQWCMICGSNFFWIKFHSSLLLKLSMKLLTLV